MNSAAEWSSLLHTWDVLTSNVGLETGYPAEDFHGFPQFLQANANIFP
jgi:hypothetical protein